MQWLNKLDGVLDSVFLPRGNRSSTSEEGQLLHDSSSSSFDAEEYYVYTSSSSTAAAAAGRHPTTNEQGTCHADNGLDHDDVQGEGEGGGEIEYQHLVPTQEHVTNNNNSDGSGIYANQKVLQGKQREEESTSEWKRGEKEDTGGWIVHQTTTRSTGTATTTATGRAPRGSGSIVGIQNSDRQNTTTTAPVFPARPGMIRPVLREHCSDDDDDDDDDDSSSSCCCCSEYETDGDDNKCDDDDDDNECHDDDDKECHDDDDKECHDDNLHCNSHGEGLVALSTPKEIHTAFETKNLVPPVVIPVPPPPQQAFERVIAPPRMAFPKAISSSSPLANHDESDKESKNTLTHHHDALIVEHDGDDGDDNLLFQGDNQERKDNCCYQNHHPPQSPSHSDTERIQESLDSNLLTSIPNNNIMDTTSPCLSMDTLQYAQTADSHEYDDGRDGIEQMQATFGDFLPGSTFQDDSSSEDCDLSTSTTSMTQREGEDYMLEGPISWEEEEDMIDGALQYTQPFEPDMNCHGIVHVRLLRIQHLPCSKGSSLQATFSLPPWKGRIRTDKVVTYRGPSNAGICARWDMGSAADKKDHVGDSKELLDADFELRSGDDDNNGDHKEKPRLSYISMVHAYNNEETPVPTISIELKDMALMFERNVCFLNISCEPLMRQPGVFRKRWCPAKREHGGSTETKKGQSKVEDGTDQSKTPLFLIEACFEPTDFGDSKSLGEMSLEDLDTITFSKSLEDGKENQENYHEVQGSPQRKKNVTKKRLKSNPHMFRNYSSLRPTYCAICNTMIAWKFKGYQCEVCKLDCCADCQLRVDVEMPCGSEKALDAVKKMSESKLTLSKIYDVIAPKKVNDENSNDRQFPIDALENEAQKRWKDGVGTLTLRIKKACLFRHNFPPEADLDYILEVSDRWLRSGDYYARVSWTDGTDTKRTKTVFQTAKPRFDSDDIVITSSHYGTEFRIEVVDATTDMAIGTKLLTTQGLLQWQRDNNGWGLSVSSLMNEEPISLQKLGVCMELRTNVKTGFGIDFYNSSRISDNAKAGEISGWIELDVMFRENPDLYSFSNPRPCPPRPTDDFNVELIQLHIARITAIVEDIWSFIDEVSYIISWKNPALTSLSLLVFITACLRLNSEYIGSFPFAVVIIIMLHTGRMRKTGASFRVRLLKKETEAKVKEMKGNMVKYKKHRPVAELDIAVLRGRNLAPNHRIPGSLVASIFWEPSKFADEYTKKTIKDIDPSSCGLHQIGETEGSGMTSSPEWLIAHPSNELERMKQLLPSKNFLSRTNSSADLKIDILKEIKPLDTSTLTFPILQSISAPSIIPEADLEEEEEGTEEDNTNLASLPSENIQLVPWESSKGAIVIQVRFADVLNKLPIFDQVLGEVVIPLARLAKEGSIEGWFKVLEKGTIRTEEEVCDEETRKLPCSNKDATDILNRLVGGDSEQRVSDTTPEDASKYPSIFLQARLKVPNTSDTTDIDKETSRVIAEHLIRSTKAKEDSGLGFLGTSISTFNTVTGVRGNVQNIQNQLGSALDMIEICKNLFNFTCPEKSGIILIATTVLWFVLVFIPTRYIILLGGLAQYTATFKAAFAKHERNTHEIRRADSEEKDKNDPILTRLTNFFISVPTNEDLRRYYFWEAVKVGEVEREILANKKRATRLTKLWKAQWFGKLELKVKTSISLPSERKWEWKTIFCIIQGHRFIWWESEKDFDEGENPSGQIYFAGHSGLAGLSPLELRELKPDEVPLVVNIFGRGASRGGEQTKISLLTQDPQTKQRFEASVLNAVLDKND